MMIDVKALDDHLLGVHDTHNHREEGSDRNICQDLVQADSLNDHHESHCCNLVLKHLVEDMARVAVQNKDRSLHVVVVLVVVLHMHPYRNPCPNDLVLLDQILFHHHHHHHQCLQHEMDD